MIYLEVIDMLINETSKLTKLTKKAIEYYTLQGLVSPSTMSNGYRDYSQQDIERLSKISVLRKLGISTEEIKLILEDQTNTALQVVSVKKELDYNRDMQKKSILHKLSDGAPYESIILELQSIEQSESITAKLLEAFPGFYGRFICMHFARFLNEPIQTKIQREAYQTIVSFLDNLPTMDIPIDLAEYLEEGTKHIGTKEISDMLVDMKGIYENPDQFLSERKEILAQYLEYKKSEEYRNSSACKLMELMKEFNTSNGYNEIFIPAMKSLSASYAKYYVQVEAANEKLLETYPEIKQI